MIKFNTFSLTQLSSAISSITLLPLALCDSPETVTCATGQSIVPGNFFSRSSAANKNSNWSVNTKPCSLRVRSCALLPVMVADCSANQ